MKKIIFLVSVFAFCAAHAQQKVIPLYNGPAPGSEDWTWQEKVIDSNANVFHTKIVYNVSRPTLTVFAPDNPIDSGTAVIVCPGGGFQVLSIESEGNEVARWLNKKGITAFVLKYRLNHTLSDDPIKELFDRKPNSEAFNEQIKKIVAMDIADGEAAIEYVRKHAAEYKLATNRIGMIGFSAGGSVTTGIAYNYAASNRPDFVAPIYPYVGSFSKAPVPKDAPPMFILVAEDDYFGFDKQSVDLYNSWSAAKHSAELHIYAKGGHGFGMRKQNLPVDSWIERFGDWLAFQGFLNQKK